MLILSIGRDLFLRAWLRLQHLDGGLRRINKFGLIFNGYCRLIHSTGLTQLICCNKILFFVVGNTIFNGRIPKTVTAALTLEFPSAFYRSIELLRFDERDGTVYIFAGEELQIKIDRNAR